MRVCPPPPTVPGAKRKHRPGGAAAPPTPGIDFDRVNGNRFVRFSYAGSKQTIEEALARMQVFLAGR